VRDVNASAARAGGADRVACASFATPWGEGGVLVVEGRLAEVRLPWPGCPPPARCADAPSPADQRTAERWARELGAYFAGRLTQWTAEEVGVDAWDVTPFRRAVYRALLSVPPGATVSYGELARRAGAPRAARAVGSAMAANPAPIVVPCHRVVRADGSPGNYGGCDTWKVELLRHEGAL
jgi:methylated-DNA-[protein]-cysteine S-methyltransferase